MKIQHLLRADEALHSGANAFHFWQVSFVVSASVPSPQRTSSACGSRAYGGGWAVTDRPARLLVTAEGRIDMFFPGGQSPYQPAQGGSQFC